MSEKEPNTPQNKIARMPDAEGNASKAGQKSEQEIQQMLLEAMTGRHAKGNPRHGRLYKAMNWLFEATKESAKYLDNFIKFIVRAEDADRNDVVQYARAPFLFGTYIIIIFIVIGGIWAGTAPLDSAAHAVGTLIPSTKKKTIQHLGGGTVKEIYVQQGDHVREGDKILELDDTRDKAAYDGVVAQLRVFIATEARLIAERDDFEDIVFPANEIFDHSLVEVQKIMKTQRDLFEAKKKGYENRIESAFQKEEQLNKTVQSYESRRVSAQKNVSVMKDKVRAMRELFDNQFTHKSQLLEAENKCADAEAALYEVGSKILQQKDQIMQSKAELLSFEGEYLTRVMEELKDAQRAKSELQEKYISYKDNLSKVIIRSPVDGEVIVMNATTIGGVIRPAEVIAEIVPQNDHLIIEAKVSQKNIDSVYVGLKAQIKFSAFKSRTTPVFSGTVTSLSPDVVEDRRLPPGHPDYFAYVALIEIDMEDFNKVAKQNNLVLHPGMQAEVLIVTGTRTLLKYLLDPVTDSMHKAFRER